MIDITTIEGEVSLFILVTFPLFLFAFSLYAIRVFRSDTVSEKVIAIDALGYDLAVFLAVLSILFKAPILIPCAIILALWVYALDIYVAKYLESKEIGE